MKTWLFKSDPDEYGWKELTEEPNQTTSWTGVRNYQARNYMRAMEIGDLAFFYHSRLKSPLIVGTVRVVDTAHPDPLQFDPNSPYFDPGSSLESPSWDCVKVQRVDEFEHPVSREALLADAQLAGMELLRKGSRLSVQPVTRQQWERIIELAGLETSR